MRVTVCELPHEAEALRDAWAALCQHTVARSPQLVLLPELAGSEPAWESDRFDAVRWSEMEARGAELLRRLPELRADYVVGTRAVRAGGRRLNQGYLWSAAGVQPLRGKYFLPEEPGGWEATWFQRGDPEFPAFRTGAASFGLNICTELWAVETWAAYAELGVELLLSPRASSPSTTSSWLAAGVVAAVRSGAFSLSSNRVDARGAYGGKGWIVDPSGQVLAVTSSAEPFATRSIDPATSAAARDTWPRYVFAERCAQGAKRGS